MYSPFYLLMDDRVRIYIVRCCHVMSCDTGCHCTRDVDLSEPEPVIEVLLMDFVMLSPRARHETLLYLRPKIGVLISAGTSSVR